MNLKTPMLKRLAEEQTAKCSEFLLECHPGLSESGTDRDAEKFVQQSLMMHRDLISMWGGLTRRTKARPLFVTENQRRLLAGTLQSNAGVALYSGNGDSIVLQQATSPHTVASARLVVYGLSDSPEFVDVNIRKGQRYSSALLKAVEKSKYSRKKRATEVLEQLFTRLGELVWAERKVIGLLSCEPYHFLKLGHYGENNSCYAESKSRHFSKRFLGARLHDSFVLLWQLPDGRGVPQSKIVGRVWGWRPTPNLALVSNFYLLNKSTAGPLTESVLEEGLEMPGLRHEHVVSEHICKTFINLASHGRACYINHDSMGFSNLKAPRNGDSDRSGVLLCRRITRQLQTMLDRKLFEHAIGRDAKVTYKYVVEEHPIMAHEASYFDKVTVRDGQTFATMRVKKVDKEYQGGPDCKCGSCAKVYQAIPYLRDTPITIY